MPITDRQTEHTNANKVERGNFLKGVFFKEGVSLFGNHPHKDNYDNNDIKQKKAQTNHDSLESPTTNIS